MPHCGSVPLHCQSVERLNAMSRWYFVRVNRAFVRISVIIPTFQRRNLLRRALNAVFAQDFPPSEVEVIVVIDGSQDGTLEMLRELRPSCRLRFLYQENKGQAAAKNAGIQLAEGEILFFLDDDILLHPN